MNYAIKAEITDLHAMTLEFPAQKTMYGGKHIRRDDTLFVFASKNKAAPREHLRQMHRTRLRQGGM